LPYSESALYVDSIAHAAVTQFAVSTAYTVGQVRRQLAAPTAGNERCFICIVAGTSAGSEPTWTVTKGAKTVSNTATFQECTALPAVNGDVANTPAWAASKGSIALGVIVKNTAASHYFICTTAGTGGTGSEPSWNTTTGATTTDGSVTWTCIGAVGSFTTRWAAAAKMLVNPVWSGSSWLINAGMTVYVGDDHSESTASNFVPAFACQVLCVDHTAAFPLGSGNLMTTAQVNLTGATIFWNAAVNGYVYGLKIIETGTSSPTAGPIGAARVLYEQCLFSFSGSTASLRFLIGDTGNAGGTFEARSCTFNTGAATQSVQVHGNPRLENCSLTGSFGGSGNQIFSGAGTLVNVLAEGCDFATNVSSGANLVGSGGGGQPIGYIQFKDCKIPSTLTSVFRGGPAGMGTLMIELMRSDSAASTYRNERYSRLGAQVTSTSVVRTGGAADIGTAVAHKIDTTANALDPYTRFEAMPLAVYNETTGADRSVTIYGLAVDSRVPTDGEVWFDAEYLGASGSVQGSYNRGYKTSVLASGSALTADTSAWDSMATARANSTAYVVGDVRKVASNTGRVFACIAAGTSAASEPVAAAASSNTFSTTDKTANAGLSNGNLTVTISNISNGGARSVYGQVASKFYFEFTVASTSNCSFGIAPSSASLTSGNTASMFTIAPTNGTISFNNASTGISFGALSAGQVVCIAIDMENKRGWMRINGGNWNNSASYNPATNVGGVDISFIFTGSVVAYVVFIGGFTGANATVNFGATSFAQSIPSGFAAGPALWGYATAIDGDAVVDGTATFRTACRFKQTLTLSSPQPQLAGYLYAYPRFSRASQTYYLDPLVVLS
jgi:hypothetical protein